MIRITPAAVLLALATLTTTSACKKPGAEPPKGEAAVPPVELAPEDVAIVKHAKIAVGPRVSGTLEAREHAVLRAELGGTVVSVGPDLGDPVKKGQILARIESKALGSQVTSAQAGVQSAQANVQSAQAAVELAKREVDRTDALVKGGAAPARDLDRARANLRSAEAGLAQAKSGVTSARAGVASAGSVLGDSTIRSPIDGVVMKREVNAGDVATPGALVYEIIVPQSMRLAASVSSEDLAALAVGRRVDFEVRGYGEQKFEGAIARIAPAADPVTRQIAIIVDIPNPGGQLLAGLYAEGRVSSEERDALVVPESAIDTSGDRPTVMHVKDGKAERVAISIGLRDDVHEVVEAATGLTDGELVILNHAARTIEPGAKVATPGDKKAAPKPAAPATDKPAAPAPAEAKPIEGKPAEAKPAGGH